MIRIVFLIAFFYAISVRAQIAGSVEFNVGLYRDMRLDLSSSLDVDHSTRPIFGLTYEFKLWKNLHMSFAYNLTKMNTFVGGYSTLKSHYGNTETILLYTKEGSLRIGGWHGHFPISLNYYIKPRKYKIEVGYMSIAQFSPYTEFEHTKTTYAIKPLTINPFIEPIIIELDEPRVELNQSDVITVFHESFPFFIAFSYHHKLKRYQYVTFTIRYADEINYDYSRYTNFSTRFLSFSIGYKIN